MTQENLEFSLRVESVSTDVNPARNGRVLADKRTALGLSIDDVSARLKYPARMIEALENDRWSDLPKGLALRGLLRNYSRMLGIDSKGLEAVLQSYIGEVTGGIANHTSTRSLAPHDSDRNHHSTGWIVMIAVVVFVVIAIALWQGIVPRGLMPEWLGALFR